MLQFALTLNIETAPKSEGVLIRYWTNLIPEATVAELGAMMVQIMKETLEVGAVPDLRNSRGCDAVDSVGPQQSLVSQLERLVAMNSNQQADSTDVGGMIHSIVDRMVQNAVSKALQTQSTLAADRGSDVEAHLSEFTKSNAHGQEILSNARIIAMNDSKEIHAVDAHSGLPDIVEQSIYISDKGIVGDRRGNRSDWVAQKLLSLWSEVLDLSQADIEANDNFFVSGAISKTRNECLQV